MENNVNRVGLKIYYQLLSLMLEREGSREREKRESVCEIERASERERASEMRERERVS